MLRTVKRLIGEFNSSYTVSTGVRRTRVILLTRSVGLAEPTRNILAENLFQLDYEPVTVVLPEREKEEAEWEDINMEAGELGVGNTFIHAIRDISRYVRGTLARHWIVDCLNRWRRGVQQKGKTWQSRRGRQQEAWGNVFEHLTQTYLRWRYPTQAEAVEDGSGIVPDDGPAQAPSDPAEAMDLDYTVNVFCLFTLKAELTVTRSPDSLSPALDLM